MAEEKFDLTDDSVVFTEDIAEAIREYARKNDQNPANLDFTLLKYTTWTKGQYNDWTKLDDMYLRNPAKLEELLRSEIELKQSYKISIFTKVKTPDYRPDISMLANKHKTSLQATFKSTSDLKYVEGMEEKLKDELIKRELLQGVLIGLFDFQMDEKITELAEFIKSHRRLTKDFTVLLCNFPAPVDSGKDRIIFHHIEKAKLDKTHKQKKLPKNVYSPVEKGEVLVEYIKPREGKNGRGFNGALIKPLELHSENKPKFEPTENVLVEEDEKSVKYIAKINGYVIQDALILDVTDTLNVQRVSLKETGSIDGEDDTKLKVAETDALYDGIGPGVTVEGDHVEVQGTVAGGAVVKAQDVEIHGQTHKSARIIGKKVKVKIHKGYLKGQQVMVNRLEHGRVDGLLVKVNENMGGHIRSKKVYINNLASGVRIEASELIEIKNIHGDKNTLIIDPGVVFAMKGKTRTDSNLSQHERIEALRGELSELRQAYKIKDLAYKTKYREANQQQLAYKKTGTPIPDYLKQILAKAQAENKTMESTRIKLGDLQRELTALEEEEKKAESSIETAKIVCNSPWTLGNRVIFKTLDPPKEYEYIPKPNDKVIRLVKIDDKHYVVEAGSA